MFGKQMFTMQMFDLKALLGFHTTPNLYSLQISLVMVLFLDQAPDLNSFRQVKEEGFVFFFTDFPSLLLLKDNQPKIILMPKKHNLGWQIWLPYSFAFETSSRSFTVQKFSWQTALSR